MTSAPGTHRILLFSPFFSSSLSSPCRFSSASSSSGSSASSLLSSSSSSTSFPSRFALSARAPPRRGDRRRCLSPFLPSLSCVQGRVGFSSLAETRGYCARQNDGGSVCLALPSRNPPRSPFSFFSAVSSSPRLCFSLSQRHTPSSSPPPGTCGSSRCLLPPFSLACASASLASRQGTSQNLPSTESSLFSSPLSCSPLSCSPLSCSPLSCSSSRSSSASLSSSSLSSSSPPAAAPASRRVSGVCGALGLRSPARVSFSSSPEASAWRASVAALSRSFSSSPHSRFFRVDREAKTEGEARRRWAVIGASLYFLLMSVAFAFVPLYEAFCQSTGYGGYVQTRDTHGGKKNGEDPVPSRERSGGEDDVLLEIDFASHCNVPWEFEPLQKRVIVAPGESALAFYRARNKLDRPVIGISLYSVMPPEAGIYFNKIQCFCFEEQMLNPHEEVDMPVFFFIDPDILDDPRLDQMKRITLSYVFNESDADIPVDYKHLPIGEHRFVSPKQQLSSHLHDLHSSRQPGLKLQD
ncbi:putative cytochrome c oxidase assembly protein COX11, mitochondrial precursor family protein [Toxoplasma gondii VAND]|uniref:Putative cytochrome c oxidase assembly protein COX11, mitochondrial family protein n=1 Tax=Toxoplasma gondii VAND TaxID=933077 RepID=A0A086Q3A6_TOXGO|nr:putative cytochrome c oxidase assembly protein COX11, mitochondrial precursor family protein [Toxoplasma gondii VAND]